MKVAKNVSVPTGNILVLEAKHGLVETVSLGDYGKNINVKADFLGFDREITNVMHTDLLPLTEKWVVTVSTQYGCTMNCKFCDAPSVKRGKTLNISETDIISQVQTAMALHPGITHTDRLNIHYARMGEPTYNPSVCSATRKLIDIYNVSHNLHPVVSTIMPSGNANLREFLAEWMTIKNTVLHGNAGLQLSINSTNEVERNVMFNGNALTLMQISTIMRDLPKPVGRKITLNFAIADYEINPDTLLKYFDPAYYVVKLTPMHKTSSCNRNDIKTTGDYTSFYPYKEHESKLKSAGYDVIVFIASREEDISKITCGNVILNMGKLDEFKLKCKSNIVNARCKIDTWRQAHSEQNEFGLEYQPVHTPIFGDRCPCCASKLKKEMIEHHQYEQHILFTCKKCGYRYASVAQIV